ncbi:MAG: 3-oxoacyl-[acyl-carrier-protein] reductase [Candidatus Latescibacterota bacterium]
MANLKDKVAVITGGTGGFGRAIALRLAREGAHIVLADLFLGGAEEILKEVAALGVQGMAVEVNVGEVESVTSMAEQTLDRFGSVDILVNNAGITRDNLLIRMKEAEWDAVITVNLKGTFNCTKAVARQMMKQRSGRIINVASVVGLMGNAGQANYSASKAGVIGLTKTSARELASRGITVNAIAPGFFETSMTKELPESAKEAFLKQIPLGRPGSAEDVANVVAFLASSDASYITGQVICVDGGMVMY